MKPGIYYNIPFEEYKTWPGVHKSQFRSILKSGLHFRYEEDNGEKDTDVKIFGNLVDTLLLEPELFDIRYSVIPGTYSSEKGEKSWNWNAKACQKWREELSCGSVAVKRGDVERAQNIVSAIKSHPVASRWLCGAFTQVSLCWTDPETDLPCKGRVDVLNNGQITDLKITDNPHPSAFSKIVNNFLYHAQGAFYHDGFLLAQGIELSEGPTLPFSFIVAEAEPPHDVVAYNLGPESFDCGRIVYREALNKFKEMKETGEYYGYSNVAEEIEIPLWARNKIQMDGVIE